MSSSVARVPLDVVRVPLQGVHLIEASAGTGKTFTITSLILRYLVERELPIESILAVTFTNAATAELKERVSARIEKALRIFDQGEPADTDPVCKALVSTVDRQRAARLLQKAFTNVDRAGIFTIHGFAAKILQDHAFESGARSDAELVGDQRTMVLDVVTDFWTAEVATLPEAVFRQIGGTAFFRSLLKVGLTRAGAFEVPLVEPQSSLDLEAERKVLCELFESARVAFLADGKELLQLLLESPALNRNKMRPSSLEGDFGAYSSYFAGTDPCLGHPATERFTLEKVRTSLKKGKKAPEHPLMSVLSQLLEQYRRVELAGAQFADHLRFLLCERIQDAINQEQHRERSQSFDGLLSDLCTALRKPDSGSELAQRIRSSFAVALIDEFQDTDPVQYEIFRRVYQDERPERAALFLIGDPKQSIYAFRGADIFTYLRAAGQATGGHWTLSTSYRASPRLVAAQNALFGRSRLPFGLEGIRYESLSERPGAENELTDAAGVPLPGISLLAAQEKEVEALSLLSQEIARFLSAGHLLGGRRVVPSDLAVLTRTNHQAQQVQALLRELAIPAVMHGDRSVFEAPEALELRRVLCALSEPGNRALCQTALATRLIGLGARELRELETDVERSEYWMSRLREWGALFKTKGVAHAMEALLSDVNLMARTLRERDGERRMTNLRHLLELLHEVETVQHLGVAGLLRWFEGAIADPSGHAMAAEARQLRLESDADAVILTTAHKSKGLEYNIVFLPTIGTTDTSFVDEAFRFHDGEQGRSLFEFRGKLTREENTEVHRLEASQEALRLGYVALTRAKHHVVVLSFETKRFSSLGYWLYERDAPAEGGLEFIEEHLKRLSSDQRMDIMAQVCAQSDGACTVEPIQSGPAPAFTAKATEISLVFPEASPELIEKEKTSSFSALVRSHGVSRAAREGRDIDETTDHVARPSWNENVETPLSQSALGDFPRGARPGDALHAMFEHCPFQGTTEEQKAVAARELSRRGFSPPEIDAATTCLRDVLRTELPGQSASPIVLERVLDAQRRPEWEFNLPVGASFAEGITPTHSGRVTSERLARALSVHQGELSPSYLRSVAGLEFSAWSGFLRGFIDLVYEWEGRIYALDYKSNHLGAHYEDYHTAALSHAMEEHHYLLQALFYCVAVHRYAKSRITDYSYARHFGGMQYLFLRGMLPGRSSGIYWFRPAEVLIDSLSSLFEHPEREKVAS